MEEILHELKKKENLPLLTGLHNFPGGSPDFFRQLYHLSLEPETSIDPTQSGR